MREKNTLKKVSGSKYKEKKERKPKSEIGNSNERQAMIREMEVEEEAVRIISST